jgi:uncharacterized membrane protein YraQ (UPF0718 family)
MPAVLITNTHNAIFTIGLLEHRIENDLSGRINPYWFEVWVKQETVSHYLGKRAGLKGHLWAIVLAGMVVGPLYVSFPLAYAIMQKGARMGVVFTYIGASVICRIPMAIFEASFLGLKFTVIRFSVSLPMVLITSIAVEKLFEHHQKEN